MQSLKCLQFLEISSVGGNRVYQRKNKQKNAAVTEGDPKGWYLVLFTALCSWGKYKEGDPKG
jgi:hypothetical protein